MRLVRLLAFALLAASIACEATGVEEGRTVQLTLRMQLAGGQDVGPTPGRVYVYTLNGAVPRAFAFPEDAEECVLASTPVTTCTFSVPLDGWVSLIAAEPDPAIMVRFAPESPEDTVRDGRYVEFTGWTECEDRAERGVCVERPSSDFTIEANFQLMQQVLVYQTGAARVDYVTFSAGPTLKVPAENDNILDTAGCRRVLFPNYTQPCDSLRIVGDNPHHRLTAFVPRQTILGLFTLPGEETEWSAWDGPCLYGGVYGNNVCSIISPDTSAAPIRITVRYTWWDCPSGPSDRNTGGCVLRP